MRTIAVKVGELYALLKLDKNQFDKALKDASKGLDDLGKKAERLVNIGKTITTAVTLPIAGLGAAAIKTASDIDEMSSKFDVSFRDLASTARQTLTQLAEDMQRSRFQMQGFAADAQAILSPMVRNAEVAAQMSVALSALTVDLASFQNRAESDVHQRLISGLLGSTEATEMLGISLRETTLQLEAERLGIEGNVVAMDDATKIRLRFISILRQSIDAQTDAVRTGESFTNQLRALQADIQDLSVTLGQELLPYALAAVSWARELTGALKEMSPESKEALIQFGLIAATVGPLAVGLGRVAQGVTLTGRALITLTRLARTNPYVVLGLAAAGLALSIEEVRNKVDDLFKTLGIGAPFEAIDNLISAFDELEAAITGLEFDPEGAQAEAMERIRKLYAETLRTLEESLRTDAVSAGKALGEGIAEGIQQALEDERRGLSSLIRDTLFQTPGVGVGFDNLLQNAQALFPFTRTVGGVQFQVPIQFDEELAELLLEQQLAVSGIADAREADIRRLQLQRDLLYDHLEILRRQVAAIEEQRETYLQTAETIRDAELQTYDDEIARLNAEILKTILRMDLLGREIESLQLSEPDNRLQELINQFGLLKLRADASLISMEDAIDQLLELRASLIALATEGGGSLAEANAEQLQLYIQLNAALEEWIESLEQAPSRLDQIREEMERALGVGMAVEWEIARATGADFDPIAYEMALLERAIRDMYEATGAITPEMQEWLERLRELGIVLEQRTMQERAAEAAVKSLADALFAGNHAMRRFVDDLAVAVTGKGTPSGMFAQIGTAIAPGIGTAIGAVVDVIFAGALTDAAEKTSALLQEAADAISRAAREWQSTLSESQFYEVLGATPDVSEMEKIRNRIRREIEAIERWGVWPWEQENLRKLQDQLEDINAEINRILQEAPGEVMDRLEEILGVTIRDLQGAVSGAFSASTAEDFAANIENALESRVRNAFVTAFLESATMAPLFEALGDAIRDALLDIDISPDEMKAIRGIMSEIRERSTPLYELLDELGLLAETTERVNREFGRLVNVPAGFKIALTRFTVATPETVPTFHNGGVMPYDGLANLRRGEVILTPEQARARMGDIIVHVNVQGNVYGEVDIERAAKRAVGEALRHQRMAAYGVT